MYFVTDLDGTFLDDKRRFAEDAAEVIGLAQSRGHRFTIATSRSFIKVRQLLSGLHITEPIVLNNGAFILDPLTNFIYRERMLLAETVSMLVQVGATIGVRPIVFTRNLSEEILVLRDPSKTQSRFLAERRDDPRLRLVNDLREHCTDSVFALVYHVPADCLERALCELRALSQPLSIAVAQEIDDIAVIEVGHSEANKGDAIRWLSAFTGTPLHDFVAFGDNENDAPLFAVAGTGYAVENATDSLKRLATAVIGTNNSYSVVRQIRTLTNT